MKQQELSHQGYKILLTHFKQWLDILGYNKATVYKIPLLIQELLYYLEKQLIFDIELVNIGVIDTYYKYLQCRTNNKQNNGGLSSSYLNQHQWALKLFKQYLNKHYKIVLPLHLKTEKLEENTLKYLTVEEVKSLFEAIDSLSVLDVFKQRYKVLLVLLYSCGLRRFEAAYLNIEDILFDRRLLVINHGKNSKQRYVPINHFSMNIIRDYMLDARITFNKKGSNALLLGIQGTRLNVSTIGNNIKTIVEATENKDLIEKNVTAHMLRHSIATHLLDSGMPIEDISLFLGHSSLESTQIYTHILEDDRL